MSIAMSLVRGARAAADAVLPDAAYRAVRSVWRTMRATFPLWMVSRRYPGVPGRIHAEDYMLRSAAPEHVQQYISVGQDGARNLRESAALAQIEPTSVRRVLDMACGHGRVLRWLGAEFPNATFTAADIHVQGVRFCAAELGATPLVTPVDVSQLVFPDRYDVIWVGSLFTHLSADACRELATRLVGALQPNGILCFTTHGVFDPALAARYGDLVVAHREQLARDFEAGRAAFVPVHGDPMFGQTFHPRSAVREMMAQLPPPVPTFVRFAELGWDNHQDVWTYQRQPGSVPAAQTPRGMAAK